MFRVFSKRRGGVSALPVVLIMASIIMEVTIAGLLTSSLFSNDLGGEQASIKALEIAKSGAHDGVYKVRSSCIDGDVSGDENDPCPTSYDLVVGNDSACVNINADDISSGEMIIYSRGTVSRREKFVRVVLEVNSSEGSVGIESFKEITEGDITDAGDTFLETNC